MRFREDLTLMTAAARMVNVVSAVTPDGDPDPQLFDTLELGLRTLVTSQDPALTALLFQIRPLGLIGFRPQTEHCAACGKGGLMGEPQLHLRLEAWSAEAVLRASPSAVCRSREGVSHFCSRHWGSRQLMVDRLKAAGQVRHEVEDVIEGYVTVVAGRQLPPVNFLSHLS